MKIQSQNICINRHLKITFNAFQTSAFGNILCISKLQENDCLEQKLFLFFFFNTFSLYVLNYLVRKVYDSPI